MKYKPVKVGEKYGRWTVLERTHKGKRVAWICRCDCGTIKVVLDQFLKTGGTVKYRANHNLPLSGGSTTSTPQ